MRVNVSKRLTEEEKLYLKFELVGASVGDNNFTPTRGPKEHLWIRHCADCATRRTHPHAKERVSDVTIYSVDGIVTMQLTLQFVSNPLSPLSREIATRKRYVAANRAVCGIGGCEGLLMRYPAGEHYCPIGHGEHPASLESMRSSVAFLEKRNVNSRISHADGGKVLLEIYEQFLGSIANHRRLELASPLTLLQETP